MSNVSQTQVEEALKGYIDPHLGKDLVSTKAVKKIDIDGGKVTVAVTLGYPAKGFKDTLEAELKQIIEAIDGVQPGDDLVAPLKEKGIATLKSGNNIFTYLPRTDRTIRLTSGMMLGSWMGSHFTNDDLVKESRREEDYDASISFEGERDGRQVLEFTLLPKADAAVVWGKLTLRVLADSYIPLEELYYDEDMRVARTITFSDVKPLGGRERPAVLRVVPADKPDEYTELVYESLDLDIELSDAMFSLSSLRRR